MSGQPPADELSGQPAANDPLHGAASAVLHGRGLARHHTLPALLASTRLLRPRDAGARHATAVLAWGRKPSSEAAAAWAQRHGLPLLRLEDAFLRSVGLGADEPPLGIVLDDVGIYYDAFHPSRLERLIAAPLSPQELARGEVLVAAWREAQVSKYNHARDWVRPIVPGSVLVVDQTFGDASIAFGAADASAFARMLEAALDENPGAPVLLKVHPDVLAGKKRGHFPALPAGAADRVTLIAADAHPPSLLAQVARVYTVTSQMGFEALLWGLPVRCFGLPFYAGWGLTQDEAAAPVRRGAASLPALAHAALLRYARYIDPATRERIQPEALMAWLALQRRQRQRFAPEVVAVGFSAWKKPLVRSFLAGSQVRFHGAGKPLPPGAQAVALWGAAPLPPPHPRDAGRPLPQVLRLEDGFLRSVGLGADLARPLSWAIDTRGIYYDASRESSLEHLLATHAFTPEQRVRAAALRARLVASGITKYNVDAHAAWQRPPGARRVVLVVGQVEDDASIRLGAPGLRSNLALLEAVRAQVGHAKGTLLLYKPHPDVVARLRESGSGEHRAAQVADAVLPPVSMAALLAQVDEVHVLTSLAGFEALLRGLPVHCWGGPFYAGWGLTQDREPLARRQRRLALDELVAGALLLYPTYVSRRSGHFTSAEGVLDELQSWRDTEGEAAVPWRRQAWRWAVQLARRWRRKSLPTSPRA